MRVLYLTDANLAPHKAPQIHVSQFLKHWHRAGHAVLLRAPRTQNDMPNFEFPHVWLAHSGIRLLGDWLFQWRMYRQLKQELQEKRWDVVYTRQISTFPALYRLCREFAVPILCEVNGFLLENYQTGGAPAWKLRMVERMEMSIMLNANLIVVPYQALKQRMVSHYGLPDDKVMVVANGVDPEFFRPMPQHACRASLGLKSDAIYVGYVGSFDFYHDLETIFHAYQDIANAVEQEVYFLMVGDGERKTAMEALAHTLGIASCIHFVGAVANRQVPEYINACDVMLALQPKERLQKMGEAGFLKTREYLACEVPVILSHIQGQAYPFPADACVYIEPESVSALVAGVAAVIKGELSTVSMRQAIVEQGSWAHSAHSLQRKMQVLVESHDA